MRLCEKCRNKIPENAKFCPVCGAPISVKTAGVSYHEKKGKSKYIIMLFVLIFLIFILFFVAFLIIKRNMDNKHYDQYMLSGKNYMEQEEYEKAIDIYIKALEVDDSDINIYSALVRAYLALNQSEEAFNIVEESVKNTGNAQLKESYIYYVYQSILDEYQIAMEKGDEYVSENPDRFSHIANSVVELYWEPDEAFPNGITIKYFLTDIDQNGTEELAIGISDGTNGLVVDLYSFDGKSARKLCDTEIDDSVDALPIVLVVLDDIIMKVKAYVSLEDYGTVSFYKLDTDGFSPVKLKEFQFDFVTSFDGKGNFYDGENYFRSGKAWTEELEKIGINIESAENEEVNPNEFMVPIEQHILAEEDQQEEGISPSSTPKADQSKDLYTQYRELAEQYEQTYGRMDVVMLNDFQIKMTGLCFLDLIDFDNNGSEELLLVYQKYDKESISSEYLYEIWQADRQEIIQIDSGTIYSNDGGQGTVYLTEYNGQRYLITGMNDSEYYHYYHGYMGGDFGVVQETSIQEDENGNRTYKIDGEEVTSEQWENTTDKWWKNVERYSLSEIDTYHDALWETMDTRDKLGMTQIKSVTIAAEGSFVEFEEEEGEDKEENQMSYEVTGYFDHPEYLVDALDMEQTESWQFQVDTSYEKDGFFVEWDDYSSFSMKNEGSDQVQLYGIRLGDDIQTADHKIFNDYWTKSSSTENSNTYLATINGQEYFAELITDSDGKIISWYVNNWLEGDW